MFSLHAPVIFLCAFAEFSKAVVLLGSPSITADSYLTTPAPIPLHAYELGKRQNAPDFCGSNEDYGSITCYAPSLTCKGTILPNHKAYQYCLTPGLANQIVYTTGLTNYNGGACDSSTACCSGTSVYLREILYIASPYTVTGYGCYTESSAPPAGALTYNPGLNVLNPSQFRISLADLVASTSSSSVVSSSTSTSTSKMSKSTTPPKDHDESSSGLSSGTKVGIGVGVGAGVGIVLTAGLAFYCWKRRSRRHEERVAEVSPSQASYSPDMSKSPNTSYHPSYSYQQGPGSPSWTAQSPHSLGSYEADARYPPQELQGH